MVVVEMLGGGGNGASLCCRQAETSPSVLVASSRIKNNTGGQAGLPLDVVGMRELHRPG